MLRIVARLSVRARAMPARSPFTRVTPALCIATSVPVPMAMPTSAAASAGASLTPSPAMATTRPCPRRRCTTAPFCSGRTSASTSVMPSLAATACAVVRLSPVSMTMRMPSARRLASAAGVVALIGSATAMIPAGRPSTATNIAVAPSRRSASARASRSALGTPRSSNRPALPTATAPAADRAGDALAGDRRETGRVLQFDAAFLGRGDDRGGERVFARALEAGAERQHRRFVEARRPAPPRRRAACLRSSVPVLSTTSVSIFSSRSSASAFLISTPAVAPLPTPTMIDIGVARPSAQGQAMIRTETAATSA